MKHLYFIFTFLSCCFCIKEDLPDLDTLLKDPKALFKLEKRLGNLLEELDNDAKSAPPPEIACDALKGTIGSDCEFNAKKSKIIKTTESLSRNAKFLSDRRNVSCATDCIAFCCDDPDCDTSVYQDKDEHNCYLFQCGSPSRCVFADHDNYWMGSISKDVHTSHSLVSGGATVTHENELQNLGTGSGKPKPDTTLQPPTTKKIVRDKPGLNESCESYSVQCEDSHAECLMGVCKCRNGYHEKAGLCRELCREEEFECAQVEPGQSSRQCVHKSYMCDGNRDCTDGSDETDCDDKHKPAYLDSDLVGSVYSNPLYNMPYGSQSDPQFPYGFPIPGLTNPQQSGLYPPNQLHPGQLPSAGNTGGGYYSPPQGQSVNVPQTGNQLKSQWPYIGSQLYPNNFPYQTNQQAGYIPQQQPVQPGYAPVVKQPAQVAQQINPNVLSVKQPASQTGPGVVLQKPASAGQVPDKAQARPAVQQPAANPSSGMKLQPQQEPAVPMKHGDTGEDTPRYPLDDYDDSYSAGKQTVEDSDSNDLPLMHSKSDVLDLPNTYNRFAGDDSTAKAAAGDDGNDDDGGYHHRHSADVDEQGNAPHPDKTIVPQSPVKTQPQTQTNSGKSKSNSEGYIDYSWIGYDSNSPRINGKKGPPHKDDDIDLQKTTRKPVTIGKTKQTNFKNQETHRPASADSGATKARVGNNRDGYQQNRYPDKFSSRYDDNNRQDNNRPSGGNRRPYNRYPDQYNNNNRHRPSHGSRYPFYESNYGRGRDRNPYPVWDSMKEEYYYPDDYDDKDFGSVPGMGGYGTGQQGLDYPYVQKGGSAADLEAPTVTKVAKKPVPKTEATTVPVKKIPTTTSKSLPAQPIQSSQPTEGETNNEESQSSDDKEEDDTASADSKSSESQPADQHANTPTNTSKSTTGASGQFKFLNVDSMEVDSYTDNSQGPIVALSLGLAITVVLLIFVGCRLRTVKRRLRKGRALHSNEADYLINGMYL